MTTGWKEMDRQVGDSEIAIFIIGALYIGIVFLLMVMAILALKIMSGLTEDKRRYRMLSCLGVSEGEQRQTLLRQTAGFFPATDTARFVQRPHGMAVRQAAAAARLRRTSGRNVSYNFSHRSGHHDPLPIIFHRHLSDCQANCGAENKMLKLHKNNCYFIGILLKLRQANKLRKEMFL